MALHGRRTLNIRWIYAAFVLISIFGWYVNVFAPDSGIKIIIFFSIIFAIIFSTALFLLNNVRRGVLCGIGAVIFLLLRILGLRDPIYPVFLIAALISLDWYLRKNNAK
jgi:hypothetical protein